jgi:23S rRNA (pseudouridine1915-N3)-methyltransferase
MKKYRLTLIFVGRTADPFIKESCEEYEKRIRRYANLNLVPVRGERVLPQGRKDYILRQEGKRIREKIRPDSYLVALDEKGRSLSSEAFARSLESWNDAGSGEIAFLLGGPYGLEEALKQAAHFRLSLSSMTLAHGTARILLLEQIYRGFTILRGEPYPK